MVDGTSILGIDPVLASAPSVLHVQVAVLIGRMLGASWTNQEGVAGRLRQADFMVVAPYNAQVRRLRAALAAAGLSEVPVGTVDKFQGVP